MNEIFRVLIYSSPKHLIFLLGKFVVVVEQELKKLNSTMKAVRAEMTYFYDGVNTCPKLGYVIFFSVFKF